MKTKLSLDIYSDPKAGDYVVYSQIKFCSIKMFGASTCWQSMAQFVKFVKKQRDGLHFGNQDGLSTEQTWHRLAVTKANLTLSKHDKNL